ncbi:hypothetical protein EJ06DRAFT_528891 [Trichodelitschia bisporula]|uniref:Uncharacterized protein n=1 Tax=Trichodelitschia bisporula TaxID=703511 RepID=A0A6G1I0Z2_9PEZI|nr:hypothetical protein EJ06DRAFT_528891 [Trichodelitschia bisporula]
MEWKSKQQTLLGFCFLFFAGIKALPSPHSTSSPTRLPAAPPAEVQSDARARHTKLLLSLHQVFIQ